MDVETSEGAADGQEGDDSDLGLRSGVAAAMQNGSESGLVAVMLAQVNWVGTRADGCQQLGFGPDWEPLCHAEGKAGVGEQVTMAQIPGIFNGLV